MHSLAIVSPNVMLSRQRQPKRGDRRLVVKVSSRASSSANDKRYDWNAANTIGALGGVIAILVSVFAGFQQFSDVKAGLELVRSEQRDTNAKIDSTNGKIDKFLAENWTR